MVDFHSHILPGMDDGADSLRTSLAMLRESALQGVDILCATPHFSADEDEVDAFLSRREEACAHLRSAMKKNGGDAFPEIRLGAEVQYFPGLSEAEEVGELCLEGTPFLLIDPPMAPWSDDMLDEIEHCVKTLRCVPVIAHIDRCMHLLHDESLIARTKGRRMLIQANGSFFIHRRSRERALKHLEAGDIHFLGSDCRNLQDRGPNLGYAADIIVEAGLASALEDLDGKVRRVITGI
jgi:protein-tyrosine phosphatase